MKEYAAHSRTVIAPDRRSWRVRRVILPRIPRLEFFRGRRRDGAPGDGSWWEGLDPSPVLEGFDEIVWVVLAAAAIAAIIFFVLPILIFLLDVVVVLAVAVAGIATRVLFGRPWKIVAATESGIGETHAWAVIGTRSSARAVDTVARDLLNGRSPIDINPGPPITP